MALTVKPSRLQLIRLERQMRLKNAEMDNYTDAEIVKTEVNYALDLYRKYSYPVIDVTYKSIEETATDVMRIIYSRMGIKKGGLVP